MIESAEEFKMLRESNVFEEYNKSANDNASIDVWISIIKKYPELKHWVIHNKTIQLNILELLARDERPEIRADVARKRKIINTEVFNILAKDHDENVRLALANNTNITIDKINSIVMSDIDSEWFRSKIDERKKSLTNRST